MSKNNNPREKFNFLNYFKYIVVFLLLINVVVVGFFIKKEPSMDQFKSEYPLIDISRNLIPQEHFINTLQPVRDYLNELVEKNAPNHISIYLEYLNTGANISINQDLRIFPASLIKVPLALAVMKKVEKGDWSLTNELVVMKEDRDYLWGDMHKNPIGTRVTIENLLEEMLINSDNTAYRMFYRNLSMDELQDVLYATGLEDLFNEEGKITAKEYTRLFRVLYVSSYLNRENSEKILDLLSKTSYDEYLGQGVPDTVTFSHKIGENDEEGVVLDSGIIYVENRPYLFSMLIDYKNSGLGREKALNIFKDASDKVYKYVSEYK